MIVTTAGKFNAGLIEKARSAAAAIQARFVNRGRDSIQTLKEQHNDDVVMIGKNKTVYHALHSDEPFFFHPNSSMFRAKQWLRGEGDPLIKAAKIQPGSSFLDCTLGLGSDSTMASLAAGPAGKVIGIEESEAVRMIVTSGLSIWETGIKEMDDAMRRVRVLSGNHLEILRSLPNESYDIVYFDPMFESTIHESAGLSGLKTVASYSCLTKEAIEEACRVAKKRVVLKENRVSPLFKEHHFNVIPRSSKFWYGTIEKEQSDV
ncbi:class I SAM-dependent methyltransferase [Fictibacillus iocasae]|uniref:Class I SAM-dependent methyltransferase n=1 Tax=Fictibacillus iocasae TaxID=2715437 RepID=A0ABW2NMY1_9BACL